MQDVSVWTIMGQVTLFYLVAFPVIGLATHAVSWIAHCWRQPGEGFFVAAVRGVKGGYASEESWREAMLHGNLDDVLDRARTGGYPGRVRTARAKLAAVNAKIKKAEEERDIMLRLDTGITFGAVQGKFRLGRWYRLQGDGRLMRLRKGDPSDPRIGLFETEGYRGILQAYPASVIREAQPQTGEWWQKMPCPTHGGATNPLKVDPEALFWKTPARHKELCCGCLVPVHYGKGPQAAA